MNKIFLLLLSTIFYLGCSNNSAYNKNLSTYTIENTVIENYTTKEDIQNIFGPPYSINTNSQGYTVWTYRDITTNTPGYNSFSASFRVGKGGHSKDNHNPQYKWDIIFNSDDLVISSEIETLY